VADLDALFRTRLETSFAPPVLREIAAASAGNPLFALEIARAIHRGEVRAEPGEPLPVPRTLQEFVQERVAELPVEVRELLFMAAAAAEPTLDLLARVAPVDDVERSLGYAVDVGVARIDRRALHFVHPLFASTLYHAVPPRRRRALHRRLVEVVRTPDERARHLSLGTEGADATVAAELDDAARGAAARGAPVVAAELSEQAHRLTPAGEAAARIRRSVNAAEYHFASGATERARELLESVVTSLHGGPERADVLRRLAKVRYRNDSCSVAAELLTRALVEAGGSVPLRAGIERDLAWAVALCGDVRDAAVHARAALERVSGERDGDLLPELLAATTMLDFMLGRGAAWEALERATALERPRAEVPIEWRPGMMLGMTLKWSGEVDGAQERFEALRSRTVETGDETSLPFLLSQMSETATWAGDWSRALRLAEEAHVTALQTRQEPIRAGALYAMALAQAHLGLTQEARASADAGLSLSKRVGSVFAMMLNQSVLGFVELSLGDPAAAHDQLGPLVAWLDVVGIREPGVIRFVPDEVESLIALGELDRADRLLKPYEDDAARLDRPWATLAAARSRALLVATTGDVPAGAALLEQALSAPLARQQPFDYGRALLVLATIQRRTRQRKSTRASADAALEIFDRLGARLWSDKARRILGPSASDPARDATATLTPAERRVAELVAAGASNREVADRLFLSVRGVEVHLTSIYRKLRISSRTQLALRLSGAGVAPVEVGGEDVVG
jgi:DNA-binding CsgD family transcriptional regulator